MGYSRNRSESGHNQEPCSLIWEVGPRAELRKAKAIQEERERMRTMGEPDTFEHPCLEAWRVMLKSGHLWRKATEERGWDFSKPLNGSTGRDS
jgi:hypothetical protein